MAKGFWNPSYILYIFFWISSRTSPNSKHNLCSICNTCPVSFSLLGNETKKINVRDFKIPCQAIHMGNTFLARDSEIPEKKLLYFLFLNNETQVRALYDVKYDSHNAFKSCFIKLNVTVSADFYSLYRKCIHFARGDRNDLKPPPFDQKPFSSVINIM